MMDNKRQGTWALSSNPDESFRQYRKLYMAELKKANKNQHARQVAQEKYHAQMRALQERIELESHFPHCRYCGRRLPKKSHRREDLICVFCLAELNNLPKEGKPKNIDVGIDKYSSSPNGLPKTRFLEDEKLEPPGRRKDPLDWQVPLNLNELKQPETPGHRNGYNWFIAYGDTR